MIINLLSVIFVLLFAAFVSWQKYKKHMKPAKYWEGGDPNERKPSTEELEQNEAKYRGFAQIGGGGGN